MPKLVKFVLKWSAIGIAIGWVVLAALLVTNIGGLTGMVWRQSGGFLALAVLMLSFAVTFGQVTVMAAVLSLTSKEGDGGANARLERWKAGHSAELDEDRPLP
jgi:hypothetical protein